MEDLIQKIINDLKASLPGIKDGEETKRAVEDEVRSLVRSGQVIESVDTVMRLERRILDRLEGRVTSIGQRRKDSSVDEWALLARYAAHKQKEDEEQRAREAEARVKSAQAELKQQQAELAANKRKEREAKKAELQRVDAEVKAWREKEVAKREANNAASIAMRKDRQAQLEEQRRRKNMARMLCQAAEAHASEEARKMARKAAEDERLTREAARKELEQVFEGNRAALQARADARRAEQELDQQYMQQYSEKLLRQEAERKAQLEKVRAVQAAQAADAATRPPVKVWVDEARIEREAKIAETRALAEEQRRRAAAAAATQRTNEQVAAQIQEHEKARAAEAATKVAELAAAAQLSATVAAEENQRVKRIAETKRKFKNTLDDQVAARRAARPRGAMSATEKKVNAKLLKQARAALQPKRRTTASTA